MSNTAPIDQRLLSILVCPITKGPLSYDKEASELISYEARLAYPVKNGIPVMIAQEARELTDDEVAKYKKTTPNL